MERGIREVSKVRVRGPLAEFAPLVAAQAREYGYTPLTTAGVLRLTANLSRWMEERGLGARDLSAERAREFTAARRAAGRRRGRSLRSLAPVLTALAGAGALAADPPDPDPNRRKAAPAAPDAPSNRGRPSGVGTVTAGSVTGRLRLRPAIWKAGGLAAWAG